jgi:hypothetical protein
MANVFDLCSTCQSFDLYSFLRDVKKHRGYSLDKVKQGKQEGCRFCGMLHECFQTANIKKPYVKLELDRVGETGSTPLQVTHLNVLFEDGAEATNNGRVKRREREPLLCVVADPGRW